MVVDALDLPKIMVICSNKEQGDEPIEVRRILRRT